MAIKTWQNDDVTIHVDNDKCKICEHLSDSRQICGIVLTQVNDARPDLRYLIC
jgi:hypothetical protein